MITLEAKQRTGSPDALRAQELIPAVYYGSGKDAVSIAVPAREFTKVLKEAGETTAVTLTIGSEKISTLIHDLQRNPVDGSVTHIDFLVIDMKKEIEVAVPIEFTGLAEAEKSGLGTLVKVLHEVHVSALPADLPHNLEVDVTGLATLEDQIHVKNISLPKGVTMVTDGEEVVALVAPFVEEKEETAPVDLSAIEVEKKGKQEEEGTDGE
ncbi:MAG TPA: 50S ribosomal protein L25 [Candidatus Paceibacterota bacterium]|jgi:large subunit ribosomal protein L25|nr:50S ribosomal protein L25 [Candidatus Paceibacterota bacterium]